SGVIHLLVLAFLLFGPKPRVPPPPPAERQVSMVFSGGQQQQATAPNPTRRVESPKGENAVTPRASQSESAPSSAEPAPPPAEVN
ncbi:hypothetical protein ACEV93_25275, partial [Vibrio parahaemolyticus]